MKVITLSNSSLESVLHVIIIIGSMVQIWKDMGLSLFLKIY